MIDSAGTGQFTLTAACKLSGTIPAGQTVTVTGAPSVSSTTTLSGGTSVTNDGTLVLDSPSGSGYAQLQGEKLINNGALRAQVESAQLDYLEVGVENAGNVEVKSGELRQDQGTTTVNLSSGIVTVEPAAKFHLTSGTGRFVNEGTVGDDGTILVESGSWIQSSGNSETGNAVDLSGASLLDSAGTGEFKLVGSCSLSGQIPSGQTVTVSGAAAVNSSTTLTSNPVTNLGVLVLDSPSGAGYALIKGDRLANDGTVRTQVEGSSLDYIEVSLENATAGKLEVKSGELQEDEATIVANEGTVTIDAPAKLTFTSSGAVFTNETNGTLAFELASATSFGKFELSSGGLHVAGGHLNPVLAASYNPAAGTEYHVITGTNSGTFASVGGGFKADYSNVTFIGLVAPIPPTVTELSPPEGRPGGYESVIIHGTGFITGEGAVKVNFGESEAVYASALSATEILADTPPHGLGLVPVTVTDENGTSSGGPEYLYEIPPPTPVVFGATPPEGPAAGGQPVTITGEDFLPDSVATIGGQELLEAHVVSETEITGKTPPGEAGAFAEINVTDKNGNSGEGPAYTYVAAPAVTSLTPAEGQSAGGTHVTIQRHGLHRSVDGQVRRCRRERRDIRLLDGTEGGKPRRLGHG